MCRGEELKMLFRHSMYGLVLLAIIELNVLSVRCRRIAAGLVAGMPVIREHFAPRRNKG